jgi:hypothetical protein
VREREERRGEGIASSVPCIRICCCKHKFIAKTGSSYITTALFDKNRFEIEIEIEIEIEQYN